MTAISDENRGDATLPASVTVRRITLALAGLVLALALASVLLQWQFGPVAALSDPVRTRFLHWLHVVREANVATWYATVLFLANSALLALIGCARGTDPRDRRAWFGLALLFFIASVDEVASLHEALSTVLRHRLGTDGVLFFPWVVPALVLVAVVALVYRPFVRRLPASTRQGVTLASLVFLIASVGLEIVEAAVIHKGTPDPGLPYQVTAIVEETVELLGLVLFVRALLLHGARHVRAVLITFPS